MPADRSVRAIDSVNHPLWWISANSGDPSVPRYPPDGRNRTSLRVDQRTYRRKCLSRCYLSDGMVDALTCFGVEVLVAGTAVTPGIGSRVCRVVLRLLAGTALAVLAWLVSAIVNSGTASAAENSSHPHGHTHSSQSHDSGGGLLGSLLGGLGNTLSGTVSNVTGTVSALTTTVTDVTTGLVGDTLDTVTGIVGPITTGASTPPDGDGGGDSTSSGGTSETAPVVVQPVDQHVGTMPVATAPTPAATVVVAPDEPASAVVTRQSTSVVPQQVWAPARHVLVLPGQPLPNDPPAPQPTPAPAVPVSFASPGHGSHGPARHALGVYATHLITPALAAFGVGSPDSAALAAQHQGLPPTTPD